MHDLGGGLGSSRCQSDGPRSSVASKRFPLSDEWLARFRFARIVFRGTRASPAGAGTPEDRILRNREAVSRELEGEGQDADDQPTDRKSARGAEVAQEGSG